MASGAGRGPSSAPIKIASPNKGTNPAKKKGSTGLALASAAPGAPGSPKRAVAKVSASAGSPRKISVTSSSKTELYRKSSGKAGAAAAEAADAGDDAPGGGGAAPAGGVVTKKKSLSADKVAEKRAAREMRKEAYDKKKADAKKGGGRRKSSIFGGRSAAKGKGKHHQPSRIVQFWEARVKPYMYLGCGKTRPPVELGETARKLAELLHLTHDDVHLLKAQFDALDMDKAGEIDYFEFFEYLGEERTTYGDALFVHIDLDNSGTITFDEYVQVCGTYCVYSQGDILQFAFDTFDDDGNGTIDEDEFKSLLATMQGAEPQFPGNFQRALEEYDKNDDGLIDYTEFQLLNKQFPMLLFPAFRLQQQMQTHSLGSRRWLEIMKVREWDNYANKYAKLHDGRRPSKPRTCASYFTRPKPVYMPKVVAVVEEHEHHDGDGGDDGGSSPGGSPADRLAPDSP